MIDNGDSLEGLAMRSSGAATGIPSPMPACSISTTTGPTTRTTTSASADPRQSNLDARHADGRQTLGREFPELQSSKARRNESNSAHPGTVAGATAAAAEHGNDFDALTSLDNLFDCWAKARRNKGARIRIQRFAADPLHYIATIQQRLRDRSYSFGPYKTFTVREKKFRDVVDAPMKDRIVHWMIYEYLLSIWLPRFIHDTYGNLPGRGTHAAVNRLAEFCRADGARWVLQLDISKYFYAVPHDRLKARLLRYVGDHDMRCLIINLVDSFRTDDRYDALFPIDSAYQQTAAKGMPIGNLPSQLAANIYLSPFDHWVKEVLRIKGYIRYVDDMVFIGDNPEQLRSIGAQIVARLAAEGLTIHPKKIRLAPIAAGVPFLGYVVHPHHISAGQYLRRRYHYRLREHETQGIDRSEALGSYRAALAHTGATR